LKTALVTGGAGFIGSHVVDMLLNEKYNVVVLDDLSTGFKENIYNKDVIFIEGDIRNKELVERTFSVHSPHYVFHLAAQISVSRSVREPAFDAETNISGTLNLLEAAAKYNCSKFIFTSSGGVMYGESPSVFPTSEECESCPSSPYGISKFAGEKYLNFFNQEFGLNYTALRYSNVYGPRQNPHGEAGVVAIFLQKMIRNESVTINGDGKYIRDYVYVEDVAKANILSVENGKNSVYNIGTGLGTDVNELFSELKKITGYDKEAEYGPSRPGDLRKSILNSSKARDELHWNPNYKLSDGLIQTYDFFSSKLGM